MATHRRGRPSLPFRVYKTPNSIQYVLGELPVDVEDPSKGMLPLVINFKRVIAQEGAVDEEDNVFYIGTNQDPDGQSINSNAPACGIQIENLYASGAQRKVELHVGEIRPIGGSGPNNRRVFSFQYDADTHEVRAGSAGIYQFFDEERTTTYSQQYGSTWYSGPHAGQPGEWHFKSGVSGWAFNGKAAGGSPSVTGGTDTEKLANLITALDSKGLIEDNT